MFGLVWPGIVVDDAIVVVAVIHHIKQHDPARRHRPGHEGVSAPVIGIALICAVFIPVYPASPAACTNSSLTIAVSVVLGAAPLLSPPSPPCS